jgi:hypothetical protein
MNNIHLFIDRSKLVNYIKKTWYGYIRSEFDLDYDVFFLLGGSLMALVVDLIISAFTVMLLASCLLMSSFHVYVPWWFLFIVFIHFFYLNFLIEGLGWESFLFLIAIAQVLSARGEEATALGLFFVVVGLALFPFISLSFFLLGLLLTSKLLNVLLYLFGLGLVTELF